MDLAGGEHGLRPPRLSKGFRWTDGTVTRSFCIITTDANSEMAELHAEGRAPVSHVTIGKIIAGRVAP
jgi:hypothetical protein